MSDSTRSQLKDLLISRYATLVKRIERLSGSKDSAADAVHDTWLRLNAMTEASPVANAEAYLAGMVTNIAIDRHRSEQRHAHEEEIDEVMQIPDELADPERIVAARRQVEALKVVLRGLTPRRRAILLAARVEGKLNREIAEHFGISLRMVERELGAAMKHCSERMEELSDAQQVSTTGRRKF
jgi:RNA polymerase sigma-70 factor (ECF subfamily)